MRDRISIASLTLGCLIGVVVVQASEPSAPRAAAHEAKSVTVATPPKTSVPPVKSAPPAAPPAVAPPARSETLEEIVARVRRRLALETDQPIRSAVPSAPVVSERVRLVWRPSVVWPGDLTGVAAPSPPSDPNHVTLAWESQPD